MKRHKEGYTLIELVIVLLFVAAFAAIAVPRLNFAGIRKKGAEVAAYKFLTELRRTRALAIANAASNPNGFGLWIIPAGAKADETPIVYTAGIFGTESASRIPYFTCEIKNLMTGAIVDSQSVYENVIIAGGTQFSFGPLGNLTSGDTLLAIRLDNKSFAINITGSTGSMSCTESIRMIDYRPPPPPPDETVNDEYDPYNEDDPYYGGD